MTTQKNAPATQDRTSTRTRFRHIDTTTDLIYVGEAEITEEAADFGEQYTELTILSCWEFGTTIEEVEPYDISFPIVLRKAIEQTALEQRMTPPALPVELPTDWIEIKVKDVSQRYTIETESALPMVETRFQRDLYGLKVVQTIFKTKEANEYVVIAKGSFAEVRRELNAARIY